MHTYSISIYLLYLNYVVAFLIVSFSLPLFLFTLVVSIATKRKSTPSRNPLRFGTSSSSSNPTPSYIRFRDEDARKAFLENFSRWGIRSECQVILADFVDIDLPDVIHSWGWDSQCDVPVTCPLVLIQEFYFNMHGIDHSVSLFFTRIRGMHIPVTSQLVANVLWVPRVEFPDYPSCERLKTVSKDELKSTFCECPSKWGERQFTYYFGFAKGPQFLNIVMTFLLHPLSHYNSITKPHARCLLSLLEHLTIDFPSHFILSIIDVHLNSASVISSSFLPLSRGYYAIFPSLFLCPTISPIFVP